MADTLLSEIAVLIYQFSKRVTHSNGAEPVNPNDRIHIIPNRQKNRASVFCFIILMVTVIVWAEPEPDTRQANFSTTAKSTAENNILPQPQTMGEGVSMRVLWTVSEYRVCTYAAWGDEEARKMLFKPLDITATTIAFDGKKCSNVIFNKEIANTQEYLDGFFHITPQQLGVEDETVQVIKTDCNLPGFAEYLRLRDRRLVIHINGVFFFLKPVINY